MQVVIEYVLIENLLLDYLIIKTTGLFLRKKVRFIFLTSIILSVIALIFPILYLPKLVEFVCKGLLGLLVSFVIFKDKSFKELAKNFLAFMFTTFLYGGFAYMVECSFGKLPLIIIMALGVISYFCVKIILNSREKREKIAKFSFDVKIFDGSKEVSVKGFLDSGNFLKDPATNKNVIIITFDVFKELFSEVRMDEVLSGREFKEIKLGHFITCNGASGTDKMFVFLVDKVETSEHEVKNACLGLSLVNFEKTLKSSVLLNSDFL